MLNFSGQTVIITGAGGNLGAAVARKLSRMGVKMALADMRAEGVEAIANEVGGDTIAIVGVDVRTREGAERIAAETLARFGRIDALANTVGTFKTVEIAEATKDEWAFLMDLNALSAMQLSRAVLPAMISRGYGRIVHVAAGAGQRAFATGGIYSASKAALMRISEAVSEENKGKGVTCNCVMPGTIDTPQNRAAMPDIDPKGWVTPDAVAAAIVFLLSSEAGAVTGAAIPVQGAG